MLDFYVEPHQVCTDRVAGGIGGDMLALPPEMRVQVDCSSVITCGWSASHARRQTQRTEACEFSNQDGLSHLCGPAGASLVEGTTGDPDRVQRGAQPQAASSPTPNNDATPSLRRPSTATKHSSHRPHLEIAARAGSLQCWPASRLPTRSSTTSRRWAANTLQPSAAATGAQATLPAGPPAAAPRLPTSFALVCQQPKQNGCYNNNVCIPIRPKPGRCLPCVRQQTAKRSRPVWRIAPECSGS